MNNAGVVFLLVTDKKNDNTVTELVNFLSVLGHCASAQVLSLNEVLSLSEVVLSFRGQHTMSHCFQ